MTLATRKVVELAADSASAALARRLLRELLPEWNLQHLLDDAELVASELVTNAILHAGSEITFVVESLSPTGLRVGVADRLVDRHAAPTVRVVNIARDGLDAERTTGRGLSIVEAIALRWGVEERPDEKFVISLINPNNSFRIFHFFIASHRR